MPTFELARLISYDDDSLLEELRRVATLVDSRYLTRRDFNRLSKAHSSTVQKRFGSWQKALGRAGLAQRFSGGIGGRGKKVRVFTDAELLAELHAVATKLGGEPVTVETFNQHAKLNAETVRRRFGSWWAALKKAGLPISNLGKRYSDDEYFENLLVVWTHHGRQPKYREMNDPPSRIPSGAYEAKWDTWKKALLAFIERVNADVRESQPGSDCPTSVEPPATRERNRAARPRSIQRIQQDQRKVTLGVRYRILARDRFRCVCCGASPATSLNCALHVDHVIPSSKGGRSTEENLRTLCERCNVGKGARLDKHVV